MKSFVALFALVAVAVANPVGPLVELTININSDAQVGAASDLITIDHETPVGGPALVEVLPATPEVSIPVLPGLQPVLLPESVDVADSLVTIPVVAGVQPILLPESVDVADSLVTIPVVAGVQPILLPESVNVADSLVTIPVVAGVQPILLPQPVELPIAALPAGTPPAVAVNLPGLLN